MKPLWTQVSQSLRQYYCEVKCGTLMPDPVGAQGGRSKIARQTIPKQTKDCA